VVFGIDDAQAVRQRELLERDAAGLRREYSGMSSSSTNSWRMGSGLHGEKRKRVSFEDRPLLLGRERQGQN